MQSHRNFVSSLVLGACLAGGFASAARAADVWLDSLDLKNVDQDWGKAQAKKSVDKKPITIGGKKFDRGVGTHVDSEMHVALDGQGERFTAAVGVDDEVGDNRREEVTFEVVGDGKSLWKSAPAKVKQPPQVVDVSVAGVKDLALLAKAASDDISYGHVDWADAKLTMSGDAKPKLVGIPSPPSDCSSRGFSTSAPRHPTRMTRSPASRRPTKVSPHGGAPSTPK